jgi:hypothetical protein
MKLLHVEKLHDGKHKYRAVFDNNGRTKSTKFGASGMDDYTITKDKEQRDRYRTRHAKDLNTNDPSRAGYLAYFLLWNKPTLTASIADYKRRFNM